MTYRIDVAPAALRQLRNRRTGAEAGAGRDRVAGRSRQACGREELVGGEGEWRVRTGDYRIVYEIHDDVLLVLVVAVGHRRDVYQRP